MLSGFELYPRWVPLFNESSKPLTFQKFVESLIYTLSKFCFGLSLYIFFGKCVRFLVHASNRVV